MIYNHKVLNTQERTILVCLLKTYKDYDKLDLLIEMAITDPAEVLTRITKKKKKEIKITEAPPQEVMFCTSDSCEDYNKSNKINC